MNHQKTPIWKVLLAALTVSLIMSAGSVAALADDTEAVSEEQTVSPSTSSYQNENADDGNSMTADSDSEQDVSSGDSVSELKDEADQKVNEETDSSEQTETTVVSASEDAAVETVDMYRFYNPNSGEHFYTAAKKEGLYLRNHGWTYEGVGWVAPKTSDTPVYRLYNPNAGDHHYTVASNERDYLIQQGWKDEGIGWYSDDSHTVALYRQYNPNATSGSHNYTAAQGEADYLIKNGWRNEGISWYACATGRKGNAVQDIGYVTYYNDRDYSSIYDYNYYVSHNPDLASFSSDDVKVLNHFCESGIQENRQAKEGVSPTSSAYQAAKAYLRPDLRIANKYASSTQYLITVNKNTHRVFVYQGSKGSWNKIKEWPCGDGKPSTPTPEGVFAIYGRTYMFGEGSHEFYASFFYHTYYFHSIIYSPAASTPNPAYITDARVGQGVSHGCVRLATENAKWIYDNCPIGTTVVVTRW